MKTKHWWVLFICLVPIIAILDIKILSYITELIREPSDTSVLIGMSLISVAIFINYLLFTFIKLKTTK